MTPTAPPRRLERTLRKWRRKAVPCCLCGSWPAPHVRFTASRPVLLCEACARRPDSGVRLDEMAEVDWMRPPRHPDLLAARAARVAEFLGGPRPGA